MSQTIFEQIVTGELASWLVWEDEAHLAFLTPFPNTRGQTVVIPKVKYGEYIFGLSDDHYLALLLTAFDGNMLRKEAERQRGKNLTS
jgi:histidine triad (HIT) family protein